MIGSLSKNKHFTVLVFLFLLGEVIAHPWGNFPLNDDWTYGKTVLNYFLYNRYHIGTSSSTLWAHFIWGLCFTKLFGFSFLVLRFSTIVSSLIGLYVLFKLIVQITNNKRIALLATLVLLFNPIYFNLTNTYMTDINFNTLIICCAYFIHSFFKTRTNGAFIMVFVISMVLVMVRQFGIIVPVCFTFSCLFLDKKRPLFIISGIVLTGLIFYVFNYYENFLLINNSADPGYPFSGKVSMSANVFWDKIWFAFKTRVLIVIVYIMVFSAPFMSIYFFPLWKELNKWLTGLILICACAIGFLVFNETDFPMGNIFTNMQLGAETFYENLNPFVRASFGHTYDPGFAKILLWLKCLSAGFFIAICILMIILQLKKRGKIVLSPGLVCFFSVLFSYIFLLLLSDMYFDRYHLPLITLVIIALSGFGSGMEAQPRLAWLVIIPMFYVSVFGTKDYITLNNTKWEAYRYLRFNKKIKAEKINAGYEVNCWNDGKYMVAYESVFVDNHNYLIQYRQEPGFKPLKEYEFQRYFPYKKDKIYIFVREDKK